MKKELIRRVFDLALKLELVKKMDCGELGVREISRVYSLLVPVFLLLVSGSSLLS